MRSWAIEVTPISSRGVNTRGDGRVDAQLVRVVPQLGDERGERGVGQVDPLRVGLAVRVHKSDASGLQAGTGKVATCRWGGVTNGGWVRGEGGRPQRGGGQGPSKPRGPRPPLGGRSRDFKKRPFRRLSSARRGRAGGRNAGSAAERPADAVPVGSPLLAGEDDVLGPGLRLLLALLPCDETAAAAGADSLAHTLGHVAHTLKSIRITAPILAPNIPGARRRRPPP